MVVMLDWGIKTLRTLIFSPSPRCFDTPTLARLHIDVSRLYLTPLRITSARFVYLRTDSIEVLLRSPTTSDSRP